MAPANGASFRAVAGQHTEPGELVGWIEHEPQRTHEVLHVRRFEEAQAAVFHVRHAPGAELELEKVAVMSGAEQHRLAPQGDTALELLEHAGAHGR